jgi:hypothetical protein
VNGAVSSQNLNSQSDVTKAAQLLLQQLIQLPSETTSRIMSNLSSPTTTSNLGLTSVTTTASAGTSQTTTEHVSFMETKFFFIRTEFVVSTNFSIIDNSENRSFIFEFTHNLGICVLVIFCPSFTFSELIMRDSSVFGLIVVVLAGVMFYVRAY